MIDIRDLYEKDYIGKEITISGWIRNHRFIRWYLLQKPTSSI